MNEVVYSLIYFLSTNSCIYSHTNILSLYVPVHDIADNCFSTNQNKVNTTSIEELQSGVSLKTSEQRDTKVRTWHAVCLWMSVLAFPY